jgi:uncharacterized protein YbaR (Trm112 family)/SAM-dependent methyltransferase
MIGPQIVFQCPLTQQPLQRFAPDDAAITALGEVPSRAEAVLLTADGQIGYPVVEGVPFLLPDAAIGSVPGSPVDAERHEEIRDEIGMYDKIASGDRDRLAATATRLLGEPLVDAIKAGSVPSSFPEPRSVWIDSVGSADTQLRAYAHLAPLQGSRFLQLGGSGSHAIKALLAGAEVAGLLSPSLEECLLGRDLARYAGVEDRFFAVVALGELVPLPDDSLTRIYGGGCLHHTTLSHSVPEMARTLAPAGKAGFVDPRENPIYETWGHLMGRVRFCGEEEDAHDHPIDVEALEALAQPLFSDFEVYASGALARYAVVFAARTMRIHPGVKWADRLYRAERAVLERLGLRDLYGNMAIMMTC